MYRIALCDDDPTQLAVITEMVQCWISKQQNQPVQLEGFSSGNALLQHVAQNDVFQVYLLDVMMPELSGIDLGMQLRQAQQDALIIYLTFSSDFAVDAYNARAFHYLLKPLVPQKLEAALDEALARLSHHSSEAIIVKSHDALHRLAICDIQYAELNNRSVRYHMANGETVDTLSLRVSFPTAVAPLLQTASFVRCGASFAVNLDHVVTVQKNGILLRNQVFLALPRKACAALRAAWLEYWPEDPLM